MAKQLEGAAAAAVEKALITEDDAPRARRTGRPHRFLVTYCRLGPVAATR